MVKNTGILLTAAVLAIIVFTAGVAFGFALDNYKSQKISDEIQQNELHLESYIAEQGLIEAFGENECELLASRVSDIGATTRTLGDRLSRYGARSTFTKDYNYLKQKYFIYEIKFLISVLDLNRNCNKNYKTILYFYSIDDSASEKQGLILDAIDIEQNHSIIILSFDADFVQEPLINLLKQKYDITASPSLVINNKFVTEGRASKEEIEEFLQKK